MPPNITAALDKELDWPMTPADTAAARLAEIESWGLGPEAQANQDRIVGALDDLPVARTAE